MEIDPEQGILVVDLEHCVSSDSRHLVKNNCVYDPLSSSNCHDVIELGSPVQCLTDINQSIGSIQQQHLTQLQTIPFQISYGHNVVNDGDIPLYQTSTIQTFPPSQTYHNHFITALSPACELGDSLLEGKSPDPIPDLPGSENSALTQDPPRFPINDYRYYKEIEEFLKSGSYPTTASENYKMQIRKRARHYVIIINDLYHNPNKPKKVVMKKEDQNRLLEMSHISKHKGLHLGIRKMMEKISQHYFWRGMYEDISNQVNSCPKCRDSVDVAQKLEKEKDKELMSFHNESEDDPGNPKVDSSIQTSSNVWANVEIQVHGPFKQTLQKNELVVTITDPESCFVHSTAIPSSDSSTKLTDFILKTFYTFGFPNGYLAVDKKLFEIVSSDFSSRLKYSSWKTRLIWREKSECSWVGQLVELLIRRKSDRWDAEMDKFMFQFRAGSIRDAFFTPADSAPFYSMFQRSPYVEDKENFSRKIIKKKKNPIQCQECDDIFTSKVLYRQHCKRHRLEESKNVKQKNITSDEDSLPFDVVEENVAWAVGELKTYLSETKDTRRKRGKYQLYSVEIQEHMIRYALKNGAVKAALYFSQLMGTPVSDSTIRNLIKSSKHFQPRVKEEIARYALDYGAEKASKHFTERLNKDVSVKLVKKFKVIYASRLKKKEQWASLCNTDTTTNYLRSIDSLTEEEKEEIGCYANNYTVKDTVNHFTEKLSMLLNEEHVREFHNIYLIKNSNNAFFASTNCPSLPISSTINDVLIRKNNVSQSEIENCSFNCPSTNFQSYTTEQSSNEKNIGNTTNETDLIITTKACTPPIEITNQLQSSSKPCDWLGQFEENLPPENINWNEATDSEQEDDCVDPLSSDSILPGRKKGKSNVKKRGKYVTYSPEMRAKIGKYAAENSSLNASKYFSKILRHDLAESTARGLKEKYLKKVQHCDVTSLGYTPRGRPLLLGKYDEVVQECLKEMARSGERLTAFLVIATAKKIISKMEPGLLKENGGNIILNNTWAKSFLRRICVRNNT